MPALIASATVAGGLANAPGADLHHLHRTPILTRDGMTWFRRKAAGGMALEGVLRRYVHHTKIIAAVRARTISALIYPAILMLLAVVLVIGIVFKVVPQFAEFFDQMGHGAEYRYAHDEPDAYAAGVHYLPEGLEGQRFYEPVPRGLELRIADKLAHLRQLDAQARGEAAADD